MAIDKETRSSLPQNPLLPVFDFLQGRDPDAICTKYNISRAELDKRVESYQLSRRQMALADNLLLKKVKRNDPCPCGSGKKYKKCCLLQHEEVRKSLPVTMLQEMEERERRKEQLEKEVRQGFDLVIAGEYGKLQRLTERLITSFPEDDRIHDLLVTVYFATENYDAAFTSCRRRWQVAQEEKAFYQENGYHKREGEDRKQHVHFYSPSTWLEKFWIAQRARHYQAMFPRDKESPVAQLVARLLIANDAKRFPAREKEGYQVRCQALKPVLDDLIAVGPDAIPHLLPLTYNFSWASLFVPELLQAYRSDLSLRVLAELSMFRFPYFSQKCLSCLEEFGPEAVPPIIQVLNENPAFDELKTGLIMVLGNIDTPESFAMLTKLTDHENPYVVNWVAQALGQLKNPDALPYLEKAKERLGALTKIAGAIEDLLKSRPS